MNKFILKSGDIVRYQYKGMWEYSVIIQPNIPTMHKPIEIPVAGTQVITCVWDCDGLVPKKLIKIK